MGLAAEEEVMMMLSDMAITFTDSPDCYRYF